MSPSRLESRIASLRSQVRRLLALHGASRVVGVVVPVVIAVGLIDWGIHLDAAVRLVALVALGGLIGWLTYRHILVPLFVRFNDLEIALRIEERWPGLNDRLASTVQFLRVAEGDDRLGSPALREATIRQTLEETRGIDFRQAIEPKPALRALGLASAALVLALAFLLGSPALSSIALRRFFLPYGGDRWPQQTHLHLIDGETPRRVAKGDPFTLAVAIAEGERMPASARATYRFEDGETVTEALRSVEGGTFRGRIETVEKPFTFSVAAGDDASSIRNVAVNVVPPPALTKVTVRLVAPSYTGLAPQTLAPGNTQVRALEGTRVEIEAAANKPIERATLHLGESIAKGDVALDATRRKLTTNFTVTGSAPFWFELRDTEGFKNREAVRYEVRSSRDEAPRVVIDEPANDRDVPAGAVVPVVFTVDDDYGIQSASLLYKTATGGSEPTRVVALPLWGGSKERPKGPPVTHQEVKYQWNLAPLKLAPGSIITFHAEARDFDDLKGPNLGKSRELRLRIVSDEDAGRQLDDLRREIREETARILAMQEQARTPVEDALRSLTRAGKVGAPQRDQLKNAEMIQRQVSSRINSRTDGLDQKVRRFLDDLKNFKIPNADARKQMEQMRAGIERVRENNLEPAEQGLTHASKNLDEAAGARPDASRATPDAGREASRPQAGADRAKGADDAKDRAKGRGEAKAARDQGKAPAGKSAGERAKAEAGDDRGKTRAGESAKGQGDDAGKAARPKAQAGPEDAAPPKSRSEEVARAALAESRDNQKAIAEELQKMLDGLSEFETYRGVVKDAQNLLKEHEQAMKQTAETAAKPELMGKTPEELGAEQKADLANLAARQGNVARGLQGLQERMAEMAKRMDESDPLGASAMREAAEQSRKQGTAAKIGEAADRLEKNQMGQARSGQEQARRDLKDLIDSVQNRRERELARLVKELKNAEAELQKLRERQTRNLKKTREARNEQDPKKRAEQLKKLAKEQAEIQEELKRQLKRLAKLNAEDAMRAGQRASGRMGKAQEGLDQDQGEQTGQEQEEALADLEEAEERVRENRREREEQLAMEQLLKMGEELKSLAERQEKMVEDITAYDKVRGGADGKLTIAQRSGVRNLGLVQQGIKEETGGLIEKLDGAPVFALTLKRAAEGMETAAQRLQSLKTDEPTQRAAKSAAHRYKLLIDSLKPDPPKPGGQQQGGGGGGEGGQQGGGDGIPPTAQLKMLKSLQQEINERTDYFDELRRRRKELTPGQVEELDRLHTDQGTLADLARDLTRPKKEDGEE